MLILEIKVVPSSGKQLCRLDASNALKCFLKSPPEKGKANGELIKLLSEKLNIAQAAVTIVSGAAARKKRVKIDTNLTFHDVCAKLGIEIQGEIVIVKNTKRG